MGKHSMKGKTFTPKEKKVCLPGEYHVTGRVEVVTEKLKNLYEKCVSEKKFDITQYEDNMAHWVIYGFCTYATQEPDDLKREIIKCIGPCENNLFTQYLKNEAGKPTENIRVSLGCYIILLLSEFGYTVDDLAEYCQNRGWKPKFKKVELTRRIEIAVKKIFQRENLDTYLGEKIISIQPLPIKKQWEIERDKKIAAMEEKRKNGWKTKFPKEPEVKDPKVFTYFSPESVQLAKAALTLGYSVIGKEAIPIYKGKDTMIRVYMKKSGLHSVIGPDVFPELEVGDEVYCEDIIKIGEGNENGEKDKTV